MSVMGKASSAPKSHAWRPEGPARRPSQVSRSGSRSRTNRMYWAWGRPGASTATASGSLKAVRY